MAYKVIVVSPDQELVEVLQQSLTDPAVGADPSFISDYPSAEQVNRLIEKGLEPITAFIVGLSDQDRALRLIRELRSTHPDILAIAASMASSADAILAAMRAGASEFLVPPLDQQHLEQCFRNQRKSATSSSERGKLICFMPAQGGNGASTVAMHVCDSVSRQIRKKVLLVDFDFHSGTIAFRLRLKPEFTLEDAIERIADIDELWDRLSCTWNGIDILASPPRGSFVSADFFRQIPTIFTSAVRKYPLVAVDFPTALYSSCRDVVSVVDTVFVVSTPEVVSLHLARRRVSELLDLGVQRENIHLVLNRVGSKKTLNVSDVSEVVGVPVFWSLGNDYSGVTDAALKGGLVPGDSNLGREFRKLGQQIMGTTESAEAGKKKRKSFLPF